MFDWNDLRYLLAVAQHRSTTAAGRALRVDQSTVQRRLAELERRIGQPLVKRHTTGYELTEFAQLLLPHAQEVERAVLGLQHRVGDARREVAGLVRVTCPEPLVSRITASPLLERFYRRYPAIEVEFLMSDRYLDLVRGQADIALRAGECEDGRLIGRKVADSQWAIYGSRKYVERHGSPQGLAELATHALVGFDESMSDHRAARWLRLAVPQGRLVARNNSVLGLIYSVKASLGLAALPATLGEAEPDLVRVLGPIPELACIWRILTTAELRRSPRVGAFFDFAVDEVEALQPILAGHGALVQTARTRP